MNPNAITVVAAAAAAIAGSAVPAAGQSFNIDIGQSGAAPPPTYAAAGRTGHWISVPATQGVIYTNLVDVNGVATAARFNQIGGTETLLLADPAVTGDHAALLNDVLITHTTVENCMFFADLEPGEYEVIVYARMPGQPAVESRTDVDQEPGNPGYLVGGTWSGEHELLVSYSIHTATVAASGPQAGRLGLHSGVPAGGDFGIGAALNGVQIHKLGECDADITGDGVVNVDDLVAVITSWGACPHGCAADIDGNDAVDVDDLVAIVTSWGGCE